MNEQNLVKKRKIFWPLIITLLLLSNIYFIYSNEKLKKQLTRMNKNEFQLISPTIAWMEAEEFYEKQSYYSFDYRELRKQILEKIFSNPNEKYGYYFEDLETGAWVGINEKEKFVPMSLFKVPLMVSILKKVEEGVLSLNQSVTLNSGDIDTKYSKFTEKDIGKSFTIKELLTRMIKDSDNTPMKVLAKRFVNDEDYLKTIAIMGLPSPSDEQQVTVKEYANNFRALYFSSYLKRPFSELALTIMLDTEFEEEIPAGLPRRVRTSLKVGFDKEKGYYHDCGIIYLENKNYLLCIMSQNNTEEKANSMISEMSRITYDFVNSKIQET